MKKIILLVAFSLSLTCITRAAAPPTTSPPGYEKGTIVKDSPVSFDVVNFVFMAAQQTQVQVTDTK